MTCWVGHAGDTRGHTTEQTYQQGRQPARRSRYGRRRCPRQQSKRRAAALVWGGGVDSVDVLGPANTAATAAMCDDLPVSSLA